MSTVYLYVKQHSVTGLKYFGKTQKDDPYKYLGSGSYWLKHIRKHGKEHIQTLEIWGFDDLNLCTEFALKFSEDNNIVESKEWANLRPENGIDGLPKGFNGHMTPERRKQHSARLKENNPNNLPGAKERQSAAIKGDKNPAKRPDVREKLKGSRPNFLPHNHYTGWTDEVKQKISASLKGRKENNETKLKKKLAKQDIAWVHNKIDKPKQIKKSLLKEYLQSGYSLGRGPKAFW